MNKTTGSDWRKVRSVFEESLLQPIEGRLEHARRLCGSDHSLWNEVRSLLDWHESSESFLETPAVARFVERDRALNQLIPGQRLAHYEITKLIGEGGMGEVYLARDTKLDRNVAIKLLRSDLLPQLHASERLLREARAVALLEHPNICHIYEISETEEFSFIVMQYVVGTTIDEIIAAGQLDGEAAFDLAAQIADGLAEAHSQGVIHRDIKPANIIISSKGQAKILDFGLAKFIEGETASDKVNRLESWGGGVMGTIPYMSPEQLRGGTVDARTDVFSFGSLLFELISGASAFGRQRNEDTVRAILNEEPDWSLVSELLRPFLSRCLAKDRDDRYASGQAVADALSEVRTLVQSEPQSTSRPPDTRSIRAVTDESEIETARYEMPATQFAGFDAAGRESGLSGSQSHDWMSSADRVAEDNTSADGIQRRHRPRSRDLRRLLVGALSAITFSAGILGYIMFATTDPASGGDPIKPPRRLYWELSYTEKRKFIRNRVIQIQTLIGDDQRGVSDESLSGISKEVDWYVKRRDSLSQEPFKEGLRSVYGRASQYVPMVAAEFEKEGVPTAIGIYQAIVEAEYRDCLINETGPTGIFQLTKGTAEKFGLAANDRCRVDLSAKAAAAYQSKLRRDFGTEGSSWTLTILSFNQGEESTRRQLDKLVELGSTERNYWAITENQEHFADFNQTSDSYLRRFFAAAIIGENPEMFGLVTPPLSTIRTRADLGIRPLNAFVDIPGGTFQMGRDETALDFEKPAHPVSVAPFRMSRTEVTNSEFADFISATGYSPDPKDSFLAHWVNGFPVDVDENTPVRFVNFADISAFLSWRSQVDGVQYRLPTEEQWEYAARNGSRNTLYPWGDKFDARCAFIDQKRNEPANVGTHTCPNVWGVQDLIGNVFEWTASPATPYAGSSLEIVPHGEENLIIRGGGAFDRSFGTNPITSAFRYPAPASRRSAGLGFRLVTSQ